MICPKCFNQLVQATHEMEALGNGCANETMYLTWEVKFCRNCQEYYLEQYSAIKLNLKDVAKIAKQHINLQIKVGQPLTDFRVQGKE